jgi:hypothetical protein
VASRVAACRLARASSDPQARVETTPGGRPGSERQATLSENSPAIEREVTLGAVMLSRASFVAVGFMALSGCQASGGAHLSTSGADGVARLTTGVDDGAGSGLGEIRLQPALCQGIDLAPSFEKLSVADLEAFLAAQGIAYKRERARDDLHYLDLTIGSSKARLRVATLDSASEAARDLHKAVLQHGTGSWGTHRSNLAVLAPIANLDQIIAFCEKTKLACWGVLTVADRDDSFVVPGGYYEL